MAVLDAHQNLEDVKSRTKEVREVSRSLRIMREHNHFRERLESIMLGGHL